VAWLIDKAASGHERKYADGRFAENQIKASGQYFQITLSALKRIEYRLAAMHSNSSAQLSACSGIIFTSTTGWRPITHLMAEAMAASARLSVTIPI
jgi:hypothetical protein